MRAQPNTDTGRVDLDLDYDGGAARSIEPAEAIVLGRQLLAAGLALSLGTSDTGFTLGVTLDGIELK